MKQATTNIKKWNQKFETENQCLEYLFLKLYKDIKRCPKCKIITNFYLIKNRKRFDAECGHSIFPTKNTIFYNSSTPLTSWFYIIQIFSIPGNDISSKEIERRIGVTYKTAWRMKNKIKQLIISNHEVVSELLVTTNTNFYKS